MGEAGDFYRGDPAELEDVEDIPVEDSELQLLEQCAPPLRQRACQRAGSQMEFNSSFP